MHTKGLSRHLSLSLTLAVFYSLKCTMSVSQLLKLFVLKGRLSHIQDGIGLVIGDFRHRISKKL